jgi:hypothetical protein
VLVLVAQPVAVQASQQLGKIPMHAVPCFGALQRERGLIAHFVLPCLVVRQQATASGFPHADCAAHLTTACSHPFGKVRAVTAALAWCAMHAT